MVLLKQKMIFYLCTYIRSVKWDMNMYKKNESDTFYKQKITVFRPKQEPCWGPYKMAPKWLIWSPKALFAGSITWIFRNICKKLDRKRLKDTRDTWLTSKKWHFDPPNCYLSLKHTTYIYLYIYIYIYIYVCVYVYNWLCPWVNLSNVCT